MSSAHRFAQKHFRFRSFSSLSPARRIALSLCLFVGFVAPILLFAWGTSPAILTLSLLSLIMAFGVFRASRH